MVGLYAAAAAVAPSPGHQRLTRPALVALAQEFAPSRRGLSELVGPLVATTQDGAVGAAGGSEAAAGELGPARQ